MNENQTPEKQTREIVCIVCPNGCRITCTKTADGIHCSGQKCKRGEAYANVELTHPMRTLTTSVRTVFPDSPVVSVRTEGEIEKDKLREVSQALAHVRINTRIRAGEVVAKNICGTGVNIICTSDRLVHQY